MKALLDLRPLREQPTFRRLWIGTTANGFGSQVGGFAVTYHIWERTHNAAYVGLIGLFIAVPLIGFALAGSAFADHVDRRRLALVTTWGQLVTTLGMVALVLWHPDAVWGLLVLVAIGSACSALGVPARQAFIPRLLPPDRLAAGLALNHSSFQLALLAGPALAGVIIAQWGTAVCFAIDAATFGVALVGIAGLPAVTGDGEGRAGVAAVWEGLRFTLQTPTVRGALLSDLAATFLAMPVFLFPVINQEKFGGSPQVLGLLTTAVAVGGVTASVLSGLITRRPRTGLVLLGCGAVWGAALAGVGFADQLPAVLGLLAVAGGADTWAVVARGTVVQSSTPESHRGRVSSLEHVVGAAGPHLGGLRAGLIAAGSSGGVAMAIGGLSCVAGIGVVAALTPQLRRFRIHSGAR